VPLDQEHTPALSRQESACRGTQKAISTAERSTAHLPAEDLELMAQNQELDVAGLVITAGQSQCLEQATQAEIDERE
jgi:hypothetical protein